MNNKKLYEEFGHIDDALIYEAETVKSVSVPQRAWFKKPFIAACLILTILAVPITAFAIETYRYNAAVSYLLSLGIQAEDLSNYSRSEIKEAVNAVNACETTALTEESSSTETSAPSIETPTPVTSAQVKSLTPTMTYSDVISTLGETADIGSGIYILVYEVDEKYELNIPFASSDAQLGVDGETLLQALQPLA